jgi:hypothetical protein
MTVSTTIRSPHRLTRGSLTALAAAVAIAGGAVAAVTLGDGDGTVSAGASRAEVLASLTPEERLYVEWVSSATPEQLAAAFGNGTVEKVVPLKPGANTR